MDGSFSDPSTDLVKSTGKVKLLGKKSSSRAGPRGLWPQLSPSQVGRGKLNFLQLFINNGIITNYKDIKQFRMTKGFNFKSDTDTEVIAELIAHITNELEKRTECGQLVERGRREISTQHSCRMSTRAQPYQWALHCELRSRDFEMKEAWPLLRACGTR